MTASKTDYFYIKSLFVEPLLVTFRLSKGRPHTNKVTVVKICKDQRISLPGMTYCQFKACVCVNLCVYNR